jgi:hypothetical protein
MSQLRKLTTRTGAAQPPNHSGNLSSKFSLPGVAARGAEKRRRPQKSAEAFYLLCSACSTGLTPAEFSTTFTAAKRFNNGWNT